MSQCCGNRLMGTSRAAGISVSKRSGKSEFGEVLDLYV